VPGYDPQLAERLASFMSEFPSAKAGKMFGMPGYMVNGKLAVAMFEDSVIVKLGAARAQELIGTDDIEAFEPMPGRAWKEWIKLNADLLRYHELLAEAVEYVAENS
jgi:hypothetical protein